MAKQTARLIIIGIVGCIMLVAGIAYLQRSEIRDWYNARDQQEPIPVEQPVENFEMVETKNSNNNNTNNNSNVENVNMDIPKESVEIPESINLAIPFTSQAPHANWELPYQEACEEASMLMAGRFLQDRAIIDANDADAAILELVNYNNHTLDYPIDMTAAETARAIEKFYELDTELIYNFSWDDVKRALAQGYPVILPAAGRQLGNPNFTPPGPPYHMLVIKGYTATKIITNDPGTRKGTNYQYSYDTLYNAAHDWNGGDVANGKKVIIIVKS